LGLSLFGSLSVDGTIRPLAAVSRSPRADPVERAARGRIDSGNGGGPGQYPGGDGTDYASGVSGAGASCTASPPEMLMTV
jgi:hypothetical protein